MAGSFEDFLGDLFEPVGGVSFRKMFGGLGVFREGIMFALVADDVLYLKADDETSGAFEAEGCGPFVYGGKDGQHTMSYRRLPERLFDDPDVFRDWAMTAFGVAERARAATAKKASRRKKQAR